ncbi:lysogeny maintenance protein PflM [Pseudomonas sp. NY15437]|uniref:lysogeny maintenance protein PflM n=1 Tax=Pseudomonas sp. NY15437 TaxID=3400360 RepID=UPI003A865449
MLPSKYLHRPHPLDCDCSVCWSRRELGKISPCQSTPCTECRPTRVVTVVTVMKRVAGVWRSICSTYRVERGFTCAKHMPALRPPKYWHVVYDSGRPTPFVPVREPFELEG